MSYSTNVHTVDDIPTVSDAGLFYDADAYALMMGVNPSTVRRLCAQGQIKAVKVGKLWRIPASWVRDQLEQGAEVA